MYKFDCVLGVEYTDLIMSKGVEYTDLIMSKGIGVLIQLCPGE